MEIINIGRIKFDYFKTMNNGNDKCKVKVSPSEIKFRVLELIHTYDITNVIIQSAKDIMLNSGLSETGFEAMKSYLAVPELLKSAAIDSFLTEDKFLIQKEILQQSLRKLRETGNYDFSVEYKKNLAYYTCKKCGDVILYYEDFRDEINRKIYCLNTNCDHNKFWGYDIDEIAIKYNTREK